MTEKERAISLIKKFEDIEYVDSYQGEGGFDYFDSWLSEEAAVKAALICVASIIDAIIPMEHYDRDIEYWEKVELEIKELWAKKTI